MDSFFASMIDSRESYADADRWFFEYGGVRVGTVAYFDPTDEDSGMILLTPLEDVLVFAVALGVTQDLEARRETIARIVASVEFTGSIEDLIGSM